MKSDIYNEAEIPGREVTQEQFNMICCRYHTAIPFIHDKDVLEVGCGAGLGLGLLSKYANCVTGGDINISLLKKASNHYKNRIKTRGFNAHVLPYNNYSFDVILCMEVLQYLNIDLFLTECWRTLNKNGKLIICIPNPDNIEFKPSSMSKRYYSVLELKREFKRRGFEPKICGAFESKNPKEKQIKQRICEFGSACLFLVPFGDTIKNILNKRVLNKVALPREIAIEDIKLEHMKLVELNPNEIDTKYKILYVIADVIK